jgi:hypothetical protein
MNNKDIEYSKNVTNRFLELCKEGKIFYHDQLRFLDFIKEKYEPVTISEYCRLKTKHFKVVQEQYKGKRLAGNNYGGVEFVFEKLN